MGWPRRVAFFGALAGIGVSAIFVASLLASGPGEGDVGVILRGAFTIVSLLGVLFFGIVALGIWFWHLRWLRYGVVGLAVLVLAYLLAYGTLRDGRYQRMAAEAERRQALFAEIRLDFYARMRAAGTDRAALIALRPAYDARVNRRDLFNGERNTTWGPFEEVHTIYVMTFADPAYEAVKAPPYAGLYCREFNDNFGDLVVSDVQIARLAMICPTLDP